MPALLDTIFKLANERGLDLDFHVDENGNEVSKGILHISEAAIRNNFKGKIVCGHCCSLPRSLRQNLCAYSKLLVRRESAWFPFR